MPRYFFHLHDGTSRQDLRGLELNSLSEARMVGINLLSTTLIEQGPGFWNRGGWSLVIAGEHDEELAVVTIEGTSHEEA